MSERVERVKRAERAREAMTFKDHFFGHAQAMLTRGLAIEMSCSNFCILRVSNMTLPGNALREMVRLLYPLPRPSNA